MENLRYIVNENGEILQELKETDRILSNGQVKFSLGTGTVSFNFCKLNVDIIEELGSNLNYTMRLLQYVEIGSGMLKYKNGKLMTSAKGIGKKLKLKERSGQRVVRELIEEDIIHRHKNSNGTYFTFNPYIAHIGKRISKDLINEFKPSKWRCYSSEDY